MMFKEEEKKKKRSPRDLVMFRKGVLGAVGSGGRSMPSEDSLSLYPNFLIV